MKPLTPLSATLPPAPLAVEACSASKDLLQWMGRQFDRLGDVFQAPLFGSQTFVVRDPQSVRHVLRDNWQNYTKGREVKRMGLLMGNGLIVSEGELWKRQRKMMQPAFHREAMASIVRVMAAATADVLARWTEAAHR